MKLDVGGEKKKGHPGKSSKECVKNDPARFGLKLGDAEDW